jgi:glycosyltransferase involved in cell wall biosynthesis
VTEARVTFVFAKGADVASWKRRHDEGEVPDSWPYGLEKLRASFPSLSSAEVTDLRVASLVRALLRRKPARADDRVTVSWEEDVSLRMLYQYPSSIAMSGVIWATDRAGAVGMFKRALAKRVLRRMDVVWTLSRPQVQAVTQWLGPGAPPVRYLRFGIDEKFFEQRPYPERPMILSAGGDRDRDPATLFEALAIVLESRPDVEVVVQTSSRLKPPPGVKTVPRMNHRALRDLYGRASIVAVATRQNLHASGMTVALEAMAVGRPVVATNTPGMSDYVRHGETGLLVPALDAAELAQALLALLAEPARAREMGTVGRKLLEADFTSSRMNAALAGFVTNVVENKKTAS